MGHIIQNTDKNGSPLYPVTVTDAVVDKEGKTLTDLLKKNIEVDTELSKDSENPVANYVLTAVIEDNETRLTKAEASIKILNAGVDTEGSVDWKINQALLWGEIETK